MTIVTHTRLCVCVYRCFPLAALPIYQRCARLVIRRALRSGSERVTALPSIATCHKEMREHRFRLLNYTSASSGCEITLWSRQRAKQPLPVQARSDGDMVHIDF